MVYSGQVFSKRALTMPNELQIQIKELLAKMTQTELAERIGCGQPVISLLASGHRGSRISYDLAMRIQKVYWEQKQS